MNNAANNVTIETTVTVDGKRAQELIARAMQLLVAEMQHLGGCGESDYSEADLELAEELKYCATYK